jgi:hypothetical protein
MEKWTGESKRTVHCRKASTPQKKEWKKKDSRLGVYPGRFLPLASTLEKIGEEMGWPHYKRLVKIGDKDWKKDWQKIGWFLLASFWLVHHSIVSLSPSQEDGRGEGSRGGPPFGEEENIWPPTWNYRGNGSKILSLSGE